MLRKCFYTRTLSAILVVIGSCLKLSAQCPAISINLDATACVGDSVEATVSNSFDSYTWDMSFGDIESTPTATNLGNIGNALTNPRNISIVQDQGQWYGFINNFSAAVIYRLHFGSSLENTPTIDTVSFTPTASNGGNTECKIRFYKESGNWYGLQVTDQERLLVHQFGNALTNNNLTTNVYVNPFSLFSDPKDLVIVNQNDSVLAIVINRSTENISVLKFGTSIANAPVSGYNQSIIEDSAYLNNSACLEVKKYCDDWLVFVASATTDNVVRLNFGSNFNALPSGSMLFSNGSIANPRSLEIFEDAGEYYGLIKSNQGPGLTLLRFGSDLTATPSTENYTNFGGLTNGTQALSVEVVNDSSNWYAFVTNAQNNQERIVRLDYPNADDDAPWTDSSTLAFIASSTGMAYVSFKGIDSVGNVFMGEDSIEIFPSPTIQFDYDFLCDNRTTDLEDLSTSVDTIVSWLWSFGGGNTSTSQDPSYQFPDSGTYVLSLSATTANNCTSTLDSNIYVYKAPVAIFSIDSVCEGAVANISESSLAFQDTINTWVWRFENDSTNGQNPSIQLDTVGWQTIELEVFTSSGCADTSSVMSYVSPAPKANFDIGSTCLGDTTDFINLSVFDSGSMNFTWDFGNGNTSTLTHPATTYPTIGNYNAKLQVVGSNGCEDSLAVEVTVSVPPTVDLEILDSSTCTKTVLSFADNSSVSTGSIIAWEWSFGDGDSSNVQNPFKTYHDPGQKNVVLRAYSGTKCSQLDSIELDVLPSPTVHFDAIALCADQTTIFQSNSTPGAGDVISSWQWQLGSNTLNGETIEYTFNETGSTQIELEVSTSLGCHQRLDSMLNILESPMVIIEPLDNQYCTNLDLNFDSETSTAGLDSVTLFDWSLFANGQKLDSGYAPEFTSIQDLGRLYLLTSQITSAAGCIATDSLYFELYDSPASLLQFNQACVGDTTFFENNYSGSNYDYEWSFGDGLESTQDDPTHIYSDSGTYSGTFKITDRLSGCFDLDSFDVSVNPRPIPEFISDPICAKSIVSFHDNTNLTNDTIESALWEFIGVETNSAFSPSVYFENPGEILLRYQIRTANKCTATSTHFINVRSAPSFDFSIDPPYGEAPLAATFTALDADSLDVSWLVNSDTVNEPIFTFPTNANYTVSLIGTRNDGCATTLSKTLLVDEVNIDLAIRDLEIVFADDIATFVATVVNLSNVAVEDIFVRFSLNQQETFTELIPDGFEPNEERKISFVGSLELDEDAFELGCAQLEFLEDSLDANLTNNSICISDLNSGVISKPFPNPVESTIQFRITSTSASNSVEYSLHDAKGYLKHHQAKSKVSGAYHTFEIDLSTYSTGVYILTVQTDDASAAYKVVKY